ncbi:M15 family metallopeptidase [Compostimonas suwonensis]|uniref:M15 family metallopeptidase n=1 Tax=Compostimonas suwonensis TaxID=1048394 RepID=UPI001FE2DD9F|nr:M15 family metallopeptidase [Compostimonas suwonensis]
MSTPSRPRPRVSARVRRNRLIAAVVVAVLAIVVVVVVVVTVASGQPGEPAASTAPPSQAAETPDPRPSPGEPAPPAPVPTPTPTFDMAARSIDDPASIWVVLDKQRPLNPVDYAPDDLVVVPVAHTWEPELRQEASDAVVAMFQAASAEAGLSLASNSAYRSYPTQVDLYDSDVANLGQEEADALTARPGFSEHQSGLAIDIGAESGNCSLDECFEGTPEGQWLAANAWRFGFLLRYPADKVDITGFAFEPWHYRYIGVDLSTEMHNRGVTTLEEFFGLPAAPGY